MKPHRSLSLALLTGLLLSACGGSPKPTPDTTKPQVSLAATPSAVTSAGSVKLVATASDNVAVTKVAFYRGSTLISEDTTAPYEASASVTAADNGTVTYRAVASDAAGNTGEASGTLTVNIQPPADTTKPQVSLAATPSAVTSAGSVKLVATASDNVAVTKVAFYRGSTLISEDTTAPYEASASVTAADNGTVTYRAVASDAAGNTGEATTSVNVNVDATKPAVGVAVSTAALDRPGSVTVTATALDDRGVTKVEFYDNGTLVATDTAAPYTTTLDYTVADNGIHTITVRAYDAEGNTAEASTTVTVNADGVGPTVSVTAQPNPLTGPGTVNFTAAASDDRGVARVEFYDNGVLFTTENVAPYTASKAYTFADNGARTITVRAYDEQGNVSEASTTLTVAIADANEPNDSVGTATPLSIGTAQNGAIAGQSRDFDYFRFDAAEGDMLKLNVRSVSVDASSTLDPYVMILLPDGKTVLEKDDDSGAGLESEIRFNVPQAGTYTVVVTSFDIQDDAEASDDRATNTYQILLTRR